jgi:hypothetical protein
VNDPFFHIAMTKQDRDARKQAKINALPSKSKIKRAMTFLADDTAYIFDNQLICQGQVRMKISNSLISRMNTGGYIRPMRSGRWLPIW